MQRLTATYHTTGRVAESWLNQKTLISMPELDPVVVEKVYGYSVLHYLSLQ